MEEKDLTVREAMLLVLDKSPEEFEKLKAGFKLAGDAFDMADDQAGMNIVSSEIFPHMRSLAEFCSTIYEYHLNVLTPECAKEFSARLNRLNELFNRLAHETDAANFTEVGDILRFDLYDFITELGQFFVKIRECFVNSDDERLNRR